MKNLVFSPFSLRMLATAVAVAAPAFAKADAPPPEVKEMASMVGTWKGAATLAMGPEKTSLKVTMTCHAASAGWGVQCQTHFTGMPGGATYQEADLFGFEPNTRKFHWFSVTNMGETHDHVSDGIKENKIAFVHNGTQDGKPMREVIDMTFGENCKSFDLRAETTVGGQVVAVLDGHASK
jgi:hypothetical protein